MAPTTDRSFALPEQSLSSVSIADPLRRPVGKVARLSLPLRTFATSMRLLDRAAPQTTARLLLRHFTHPRRAARTRAPVDLPPGAQRIELRHRGERLQGWHCGRPDRRILLVHGWEDHSGGLVPLARRLLEQGFGVLALDAPGHGRSARMETDLVDAGSALSALLQRHGRVHGLVAHSWGAAASVLMLARNPQWMPQRLALISPMRGIEQHLGIFAGIAGLCPDRLHRLSSLVEARLGEPLSALCAVSAAAVLDAPGLVIHDRHDPLIPHSVSQDLVQRWTASVLMTTRELGHRRILLNPAVQERIAVHLSG